MKINTDNPPGRTHPPFSGIIDDPYVFGRGATDMKSSCAAIISACEALANHAHEIPVTLVLICYEKTGGKPGSADFSRTM